MYEEMSWNCGLFGSSLSRLCPIVSYILHNRILVIPDARNQNSRIKNTRTSPFVLGESGNPSPASTVLQKKANSVRRVDVSFLVNTTKRTYRDEVEPNIVYMVKGTLSGKATSIAFHLRLTQQREHIEPAWPTVIVFVKPETSAEFEHIERRILEVIKSPNFPDVEMCIEILSGAVTNAVLKDNNLKAYI
ncbi:uncharacterized protein RSE6_01507 [Rhynchosporium secalis]|uniref:Uncharacterized protein n=1 Tax=Rhynchosporium secalis TaxID=38038 RepID=A0A1E1LY23_RHYSE|nr:uncharacterized protein RSE6_01507 [Rhynchosporium secalis]